jgi:methanogenic corrinoid protein MtbC1
VVTGVEGELHQVGAAMVADVLELHGWEVCFLGTNLPDHEVVAMVRDHGAQLLCVSAATLPSLEHVREITGAARADDESLRVIVGGAAFRQGRDLVSKVGAHGSGTSLRDLTQLVDRIMSAP